MSRREHYADFYGRTAPDDERPELVVVGNCQAEALRLLLDGDGLPYRGVRMPPVHELAKDDLPHLEALLSRTRYAVLQPIADDYRGLPLGAAQLRRLLPADARVVMVPVLFYSGTLPWQALIRDPRDGAHDPPVVPYHDLRTLAQAATGSPRRHPQQVAEHAAASIGDLRAREDAYGTVRASDLLSPPYADLFHTINHPGNRVLVELARRVRRELGLRGDVQTPEGTLLSSVISPVEPFVADALGIEPRGPHWLVHGQPVDADQVVAAQLEWYAENPPVVQAGLKRHGERMRRMGLL